MGMMTIRNIPDEIHDGLRIRAKQNKRSAEAEVRAILEEVIQPKKPILMGDALAELGRELEITSEDWEEINRNRKRKPAEPMRFKK